MGGGNQGLWKELNIGVKTKKIKEKERRTKRTKKIAKTAEINDAKINRKPEEVTVTSFKHPTSKTNVWLFPDMPHLLKLLRNNFLDHGITFTDGKKINKHMIECVIEDTELKLSPKLSSIHINVKQSARQKVSYAAQLFSHHTASLLKLKFPHDNYIYNFFETVDKFFDVMNSRFCLDSKKKWHSAFGMDHENQLGIINEMEMLIRNIRFGDKKGLMPFQKGFLMSISSLKGLFEDLREKQMKYLITCRLNQDILEGFFSRIRAAGFGYGNPTPTEFKNRMRRILLGTELPLPTSSNVTENECSSLKNPYLTSEVFKNIKPSTDNRPTTMSCIMEDIEEDLHVTPEDYTYARLEALRYIAGYLAFKDGEKKIYSEEDIVEGGWIETLSIGGLTTPNNNLLEMVTSGNRIFKAMHNEENNWLRKEAGIVQSLFITLCELYPNISTKIIKRFARTRVFIRVKFLNRMNKGVSEENRNKSKLKMLVS